MTKLSPRERFNQACREERYLTQDIRYHDDKASALRKLRQSWRAKRDRAEKAIEREAAKAILDTAR